MDSAVHQPTLLIDKPGIARMMSNHFLDSVEDADLLTDLHVSDHSHYTQVVSAAELPKYVPSRLLPAVSKSHLDKLGIGCMELKMNMAVDAAPSAQQNPDDNIIYLENQNFHNGASFQRELTVPEDGVQTVHNISECNDVGNELDENVHCTDHIGLEPLVEWLGDGKEMGEADFKAVDSEKEKNPPYLIEHGMKSIITKNKEPITFVIKGATPGQIVTASLRCTEEKYKNTPVHACKMHMMDKDAFAFSLSTSEKIELEKEVICDHPTISFALNDNLDACGNLVFYITLWCLNSCMKDIGKKIQLVLKLCDPMDKNQNTNGNKLVKESCYAIRACKNVKRDFREYPTSSKRGYNELFPEDDASPLHEKRPKPEAFINSPKLMDQEKKPSPIKKNLISVKKEAPVRTQEKPVNKSITVPKPPEPFYLVQLPNPETRENVLQTIRLFGGIILKPETVYRVEENGDDNELYDAP